MKNLIPFFSLLLIILSSCDTKPLSLSSPDTSLQIIVTETNGQLQYSINTETAHIIEPSILGLETEDISFSRLEIVSSEASTYDETWPMLFGKCAEVRNHYNQLSIVAQDSLGHIINIEMRAFDDGLAFRYTIPQQGEQKTLTVTKDLTEFNFEKDYLSHGSIKNIEHEHFHKKPTSEYGFSKLPLLVNADHHYIAINEAAVNNFSMMYLDGNATKYGMTSNIGISKCKLPLSTPWRVVQVAKRAGDLINSNILVNLNPPCKIEDTSWIKPGKSLWDWRNHGDTIGDFVYGINEESYYRFVDFAAESNFEYVLFDADWYSELGPQYPREDLDIVKIIDYAKTKDVGVLLYLDRRRKGEHNNWRIEDVLKTFSSWGVKGIKYGFLSLEIKNDRKKFVDTTRDIISLCADYKMMINFHDNPVHPGGEERTYPNRMAIEYCHAQQDARTSFTPHKAVSVPYTFGLCGALDMANGYYDLDNLQNRIKVDKKGLNSTVVSETARCMVNYSPLTILPDNGDVYRQKSDLFDYIKQMPNTWDESVFVDGTPENYIVMARRSGDLWFVAGVNNEEGRTITLNTDFLTENSYNMTQYLDAPETHYLHNKDSYTVKQATHTASQTLEISMAPGGGFAIIFQ